MESDDDKFWGNKGVMLIQYLWEGTSVKGEHYCIYVITKIENKNK